MNPEAKRGIEYTVKSARWLLARANEVYGRLIPYEKLEPGHRMSQDEFDLRQEKDLIESAWREILKYYEGHQDAQIQFSQEKERGLPKV